MFIVNSYKFGAAAPVIDADAQAFLTAAGIVDATIVNAINDLVVSLKADSLWTKFRYIYPFVGGTATTNKYNLRDPQDLDAAFRITFFGGITHTNGFNPNGTNGYGDTFCTPSGNVTLNSEHLYVTSNTDNTPVGTSAVDVGSLQLLEQSSFLAFRFGSSKNLLSSRMNSQLLSVTNTNALGSFCAVKNGTTNLRLFKNSALSFSGTSGGTLSNLYIFIGTLTRFNSGFPNNSGPGNNYSNQNYTFATYGDGLSDTDVANLTTIEQTFNTALGR